MNLCRMRSLLENLLKQYYRFREDQDDGGYLTGLVETCQSVLSHMPQYHIVKPYLLELCGYYCDLQIHKHVSVEERESRLQKWFEQNQSVLPEMSWYEFSACSGSTLGIFCLISYALRGDFQKASAKKIRDGYFPYIQGLHILLDYFIDQDEDRDGGDLNFCFYYEDQEQMLKRFIHFLDEADKHTKHLPDRKFHKLINRGLLGVYLSDNKVANQQDVKLVAKKIMKRGGSISYFFYWNGRVYRRIRNMLFTRPKVLANKMKNESSVVILT